jgi:5,10-methylenetetrahydromethanopterin reductase
MLLRKGGTVRFGVEFVPREDFWKIVSYGIMAEKYGFNTIWVTHHFNNQDVYIILATIANYTEKILLGPGITNPYTYNPVLNASALLSLDKVSGGRAVLGIGAGDSATLSCLGIKRNNPVKAVEESVTIIRELWSGKPVTYEGEIFKIKEASLNIKASRKIPIYIGAQGPKMLAMAARVGDGVLINASHPRDVKYAVKQIKKVDNNTEIIAFTCFSVDEDSEKARKAAKPIVAFIVAGAPDAILKRHEISVGEIERVKRLLNQKMFKKAFNAVSDRMIDSFSIYGTPEDCLSKVERLAELGVSQIVVGSPIGPNKKDSLKMVKEIISKLN